MQIIQQNGINTFPGSRRPVKKESIPVPATTSGALDDLERMLDVFLSSQSVKPSTRKTYRESLTQYIKWLRETGRDITQLTTADIVQYKDALLRSGHQKLTVRSYIVAVRKLYRYLEGKRIYANIAEDVKVPKVNQGGVGQHFIKMHLSEQQGADLLEQFRKSKRNYAMVNLMLRTGLRTIEVSRARIEDIKFRSGKRILQVWGKGMDTPDPSSYVVLTDASYGPIQDYLETRTDALGGEPLFATEGRGYNKTKDSSFPDNVRPHSGGHMSTRLIQMIVKEGLRAIGLDDHTYSAHSLRHTTATQIIRKGGSIMDVKRTLRHSSINTSMIYIASIEDEERLKNAPETLLDNSFKSNEQ